MKDETGGVAIEEFVELKPRMYSFLVDIKKQKAWIKSYNQYKDVLLNKKCIRHSMRKFYCLVLITKYIFKTMDMIY